MIRRIIAPVALAVLTIHVPSPLPAQSRLAAQNTGSITLYVKDEMGRRLTIPPQVTVIPTSSGMPMPYAPMFTGDGGIVFSHLVPGEDYELIIKADGYRVTNESISLPLGSGAAVTDMVYLRPISHTDEFAPLKGQYVLAPKAEKEVQQGLSDARKGKFDSARKHLEKALQMAPGNPYVNYVMGTIYLMEKQAAQAKPFLEKSVSIDPKEPPSLYALGSARFQLEDYAGAIQALEQDVQLDASSYKAEWLLALAYLRQRNYVKARDYAEAALKTGKDSAAQVQLLVGEALAGLGQREKAANTLEEYLRSHLNDPNAPKIRGYVETLRQPLSPEVVSVSADESAMGVLPAEATIGATPAILSNSSSIPSPELPPKESWSPPDVDAAKPYVISGAACVLPKVLQAAEKNAVQLVTELQEFSAVEEYESVEIKRNEQLEKPKSRIFDYVVLIDSPRPGFIHVSEERDAREGESDPPGPLRDEGAAARVLVFHPGYRDDYDWQCEGVGEWKGKPAWVLHFEPKPKNVSSLRLLAGFQTPFQLYPMQLKGRAWISEKDGHVMHMDTDLMHPMPEIGLVRQHFAIDYKPVSFHSHHMQLWLPESVDVYYRYRGHYYHNSHHYTKFKLFWTGASEKMGKPKGIDE